jgi:transcriptional regulator with XRE-family HTH domain
VATPSEFTERFKRLRRQAGYTAKSLAQKIGVTHATIANTESGRKSGLTNGMSVEHLILISKATNIPITAFVPELEECLPTEKYLRRQELLKELSELED